MPVLSAIFEFITHDAFYLPKPKEGQTENVGNCILQVEVMLSDRCVQPQSDDAATKDTLIHQNIRALGELSNFLPNMHVYSVPGRPAMLPPAEPEVEEEASKSSSSEEEEEEESSSSSNEEDDKNEPDTAGMPEEAKEEAAKLAEEVKEEKARAKLAKARAKMQRRAEVKRAKAKKKEDKARFSATTLLASAAPPANSPAIDQALCVGLRSSTTLRKYQLRCVKWMTHQEAPVESASDALALHPGWREFTLPQDNLKLYQHITVKTAWTFRKFSEHVFSSGGILGDEVR